MLTDFGCVWYYDFTDKKCDFKPNIKNELFENWVFKKSRFENVENYFFFKSQESDAYLKMQNC
jgi:acetylglutamate synthase